MDTEIILLAATAWMAVAAVTTLVVGRAASRAEDDRELAALRRDVLARTRR